MRIILLMVIYFFLPGSVSLAILRSGLPASCSACIAGKEIVDVHHTLWARVRMSSFCSARLVSCRGGTSRVFCVIRTLKGTQNELIIG
ncbi:hypothetical protein FZ929_07415 [Klebsiella pneumoniae]|uniref:Uncharacterized protein n=1 Tax=Klebsiella pneumoniae TaxID=573 RepID=A0A5C2LJA7_KLEPN|nr:hypothetical protein FZ929_07415 [Klebsiella pneumoniae]QEP92497.1 hypothetical protein FZ928_12250 [Klebsiella pneumoniae]